MFKFVSQLRIRVADVSKAQQKAEHERERAEMKILEVSSAKYTCLSPYPLTTHGSFKKRSLLKHKKWTGKIEERANLKKT